MKERSTESFTFTYPYVITAVKQATHIAIVAHMQILIIVPFNRLQLPVAGISDGKVNTNTAALLISYIHFIHIFSKRKQINQINAFGGQMVFIIKTFLGFEYVCISKTEKRV